MELLRAILFYRTSSCFGIEKLSNGNAGLHENRRLYGPAGARQSFEILRQTMVKANGELLRDIFSTAARRKRQKAFQTDISRRYRAFRHVVLLRVR